MPLSDKVLQCFDCEADFVFSIQEQAFFTERAFALPKRCGICRTQRRDRRGPEKDLPADATSTQEPRPLARAPRAPREPQTRHPAICSECGMATTVPFVPKDDRPIFCKACYRPPRAAKTPKA